MIMIQRSVVIALIAVTLPQASAAQERDWERYAEEISRRAERHVEQFAQTIERRAEELARLFEARLEAQRGRQGRNVGRGPEHTEQFSRTVRLGRTGSFDLQNVSGDIVVTGGGGDDVRIEATKRVRHPSESEAKKLLSEITIQIQERSGRVEVRTDYPPRRNWSGGVDFNVSVPRDASVALRSISGTVKVSNINGELRAETVSGDVIASSARRLRMAKTVSGNLEISDAEADELTASSVSGDVIINRLKAQGLNVSTVSADLSVSQAEIDRATVRSVSGDIEYNGRLVRNGRYEFQSHSGDVRVTPADDRGFSIEATTFSGDVRSDYALTLQSLPGNSFARPGRNRSVRGSFGDASATLMLQSFSGDIVIVKR